MQKSESIIKITAALSKFQEEVRNPPNSANNPFFKSKYAPLDVVINTIKPILGKYGLSYIQMPGGDGDHVTCVTVLMCEGEWIESDILVLKAEKVTAQGAGSAISYARRYQLVSMLGLSGEDDDGNVASGDKTDKGDKPKEEKTKAETINAAQQSRLYAIANSVGRTQEQVKEVILKKYKKTSVSELTKAEYDVICNGYEKLKK